MTEKNAANYKTVSQFQLCAIEVLSACNLSELTCVMRKNKVICNGGFMIVSFCRTLI